jgi:uncharacterized protein (TIGR02646 family)
MKRVCKGAEPPALTAFKTLNPEGTWNDIRNDQAYEDCRSQAIRDQKSLCAYCEKKLNPLLKRHCQVEHFHSKSDKSTSHNWALDWQNMLATCVGGRIEFKVFPLPDNLSCDAYKDHLLNKSRQAYNLEETLLNPLDLPSFPNIFHFNVISGCLSPNIAACEEANVDINKLENTIKILNLNCDRLKRARQTLYLAIKRREKELLARKHSLKEAVAIMLKQYFGNESEWPEYFTTYRCCLGPMAEKYLQSIHYNG